MHESWQIEANAQFAQKLEFLAKLVRSNLGFSWSEWSPGTIYVNSAEEMAEVAKALTGKWEKSSTDYSYRLSQKRTDTRFQLEIVGDHDRVCEKVGEESVEHVSVISDAVREAVLAGEDKVVTTHVKSVWKCPPSIMSALVEDILIVDPE
jgi:phosphoribosyl-ATP pyrophosphohydrolase